MGDGCPISPTKGSRTAQSAAMEVGFKERDARRLMRAGDWDGASKIQDSISPEENRAEHIVRHGSSTYRREDILIPRKEESGADNNPRNPAVASVQPR